MFTLIFVHLLLQVPLVLSSFIHPRCFWRMKENEDKDRDLKIQCKFNPKFVPMTVKTQHFREQWKSKKSTTNYQIELASLFSVAEINRNLDLLPNVSLTFDNELSGCKNVSQFYSQIQSYEEYNEKVHNYLCYEETICTVVISGPSWEASSLFGKIMDISHSHQLAHLTFGPFHPILSDQGQFPYMYQMAPEDTFLALAMVSLMLHFNWNWVGLAISETDQGIQFLSDLRGETEGKGICLAFVIMIPVNMELYMSRCEVYNNIIMTSSTNVVIIYGDTDSILAVNFRRWGSLGIQKIWVTTSQWDATTSKSNFALDSSHGILAFAHHRAEISGFKNFVQTLNSQKYSEEYLASLEWMSFNCEVSPSKCKTLNSGSSNVSLKWIMEQTFDMAFSDVSYNLYNAVYTVAHVLHEILLQPNYSSLFSEYNCLKMHSLFRNINFINPVGDRVIMNQREMLQPDYDIFHTWNFQNGLELKVEIGKFRPYVLHGKQLHLYEDMIECATGSRQMLPSVCSADCGPGFRKFRKEGMAACCFDCSPCPENEVSNETNVDQCVKCPEDQYANAEQTQCIPKAVIFLTYEDPLGMALTLMALCFTAFTSLVLGLFVKHHDTPIVKANNRTLSYTLLISLLFCFLCALLFIGHPNATTCILQQITFGVVFTVAVSTVLAKTVTVVLAFKITSPGRRMRFYLTSGAPNYIIAICTLIQIIVSAIWIGVSPPSIDSDAHSEHGKIIIVCDKGSVTAFYCILGYHGSLAFGSFIVAFLARNLPDKFNEAKLLTFSMLLFCSVWVTFLPVYHSTKGKVMVAVEVFSILASSIGLLGCIFFPKCYIILIRPERNSLPKLKEKTLF